MDESESKHESAYEPTHGNKDKPLNLLIFSYRYHFSVKIFCRAFSFSDNDIFKQ